MTNPTYYIVTTPSAGRDGKTRFRQIGIAFPERPDAKSAMKIKLDALPLNGELVLFPPRQGGDDDPIED